MAYLKQIIVENFKSWQGKQVIGPFMRFNCIIGTNGSGKSNVMDALSFAMGERATSLRVKHLRDLVHGAHIGQPVSDSARVTMLFCGDGELETAFSRTITVNSSEYSINGVHVIFGKYTEELKKIGIVTKTQNCLVFQGAVESIALKDPKERTKMLEHISQSKEYAEEYNKKKEAMLKAKEDTQFHFNKKKSAMVERRQVSQEKTEAEKYQALQDHLQQNRMQLSLAELYNNEKAISVLDNNLREGQLAAASKNNTLRSSEQNVKNHKKEHGRRMREQQHIEKEICNQEHLLEQSRSQYIKAKVNTSHLMKKAEQAHKILDSGLQNVAKKEQELQNGQQELAEVETTWRVYEKQVHEEESLRERDVELNEDQLEKYRELKELARKKGAVLNQQAKKMYWDQRADSEKMVAVLCRSTLEESRNNEESLSAELQRGSVRCEEVKQELSQVLEELRNAGLENQESKRQLQRRELMEKLRRLYPENVYGRLSELCSPIHKKYQLAVTKVFARYMNAIVVASEKVARECIAFIKEERAEPEMFLPIDYLDVNPLNERLRELPGAKMIVDVVEVNTGRGAAQLRKVIQFVCGNALVCDTIKEARALAYERHQRLTTVALDGTMFLKSGVISGGSSDLRTKARRWNEKDMTHLKERKDQLTTELRDLMRLKRKESDLKQLIAHAQGVQTRMKYSKTDWNNLQEKSIPRCQAIEDIVFKDFCAEVGISSIREYEQEHLKQQAEVDKKRLNFESQCSRLKAKLEYDQDQLEQQRKKLQKMKENINKEEKNMEDQRKVSLSSLCSEAVMSDLDFGRDLVKLQQEVMTTESALEEKRLAKHNLLLACKIQSLPINLASGSLDEISEIQLDADSESTAATLDMYEREAHLVIDYAELEPDLQTEEQMKTYLSRLREEVCSLEAVLHRTTAPNLKALEKMREVKNKLQGVEEAFDASSAAARKCSQEFNKVKAQRFHLFSQCFEHVAVVIDQIYKRICRNSSAQAILSADNPEEPYLGGITYSCVAPGKRFMSMDNLSGGEKALAALAWIFAVHRATRFGAVSLNANETLHTPPPLQVTLGSTPPCSAIFVV
uniref:Structural maintenance of chromosomes protein 1B-like n=1 Tax=Gouania willdenowi TaxID=441366 RepID=A0A8C5G8L7_GOUWI